MTVPAISQTLRCCQGNRVNAFENLYIFIAKHIKKYTLMIHVFFLSFSSDHDISRILHLEVSIIRKEWIPS